jgi:uncharacterized nucleotidyltransferase DUF6036
MMKNFNIDILYKALSLLENRMKAEGLSPVELVVCGGSALIAAELVSRTTKDVDIVTMVDEKRNFIDPDPLPEGLIRAAGIVADTLDLPTDWLNTGPADLFRMGLPSGFKERLLRKIIGEYLVVNFISRLDQIYFKLYASVDRGGYHIEDLLALKPTDRELIDAGKWTKTHDVSEGYAMLLKSLLIELGYKNAASGL